MATDPVNTEDVHELARELSCGFEAAGEVDASRQFDAALCLGSSGLECLGAIGSAILQRRKTCEQLAGHQRIAGALAYIDAAFGRT